VTAQLIRADDGFHIWSQNYTRPLEDIFAIQDEIAADVADALGSSLLGTAADEVHVVNTSDLTAYDSYLKGLEQQAIYSYGSLNNAENHFKQALAQDPDFTDARLALARNYLLQLNTGLIKADAARAMAEPLLRQVREQEPDNPLARALELSLDLYIFDPSRSAAEMQAIVDQLQDLLLVLPTEALIRINVAATLFNFFANEQQAIDVLQAGLIIDPLAAEFHRWLGRFYADSGRLEEARSSLRRTLELAPDNPNSYSTMFEVELAADNLPAALDWMRQASLVDRQDHELAANIASLLYGLKLPEEGDYWLARVQALAPGSGVARGLEVERAVARDEPERVIELAEAVIADQIDDRRGAFGETIAHYVEIMVENGRGQEAYEFLVSVRPEITDYSKAQPDIQGMIMQWASIHAMTGFKPFEERSAAWSQFTRQLDAQGFPWKNDPADELHTWDYMMNGEVEKAVDHYLEYVLNQPLADYLDRHRKRFYSLFGPMYEDPRVAAGLASDAERYAEVRKEVQEMLRRPEWSNP
jgi:tetratricopeptide (TPR) repeat protein